VVNLCPLFVGLCALLGRRDARLFWQAPDFYEKAPPAPPGLVWYEYRDDVPPLPQPAEYFNSSRWAGWVWRYDENFQISDYTFSNLDLTTMANVGAGDPRVWVHIVSAWVISWFAWRVRGAPHTGCSTCRLRAESAGHLDGAVTNFTERVMQAAALRLSGRDALHVPVSTCMLEALSAAVQSVAPARERERAAAPARQAALQQGRAGARSCCGATTARRLRCGSHT